ncbi:MAG: hypothetical protein A3F10_00930 [Coxiella sp. RIFCSPHIGHO2_12_FULL_42_15]|nr:MAG: hypothetical protein A3F10_00930 [Coxiella sp. RIFCSPHIGHO2_12_FULL_42_15]
MKSDKPTIGELLKESRDTELDNKWPILGRVLEEIRDKELKRLALQKLAEIQNWYAPLISEAEQKGDTKKADKTKKAMSARLVELVEEYSYSLGKEEIGTRLNAVEGSIGNLRSKQDVQLSSTPRVVSPATAGIFSNPENNKRRLVTFSEETKKEDGVYVRERERWYPAPSQK